MTPAQRASAVPGLTSPQLAIFNPLPHALRHYRETLAANLLPLSVQATSADFELGNTPGRLASAWALARATFAMWRQARAPRPQIVIWPVFGLMDLAVWWLARPHETRWIVVHDPVPLRRQFGYGRFSYSVARRLSRRTTIQIVTHTRLAAEVLERRGVEVAHVLPHPVLPRPRASAAARTAGWVLVAGQHKTARDLALLEGFAAGADPTWQLKVAGRGWPLIAGWDVEDRFLEEHELGKLLRGARAVLIPYGYYFQSGIAARAFELGVPVVAKRHEYVQSLYGTDWPGHVDGDRPEDWVRAVREVAAAPVPSAEDAATRISEAWATAVTALCRPTPASRLLNSDRR